MRSGRLTTKQMKAVQDSHKRSGLVYLEDCYNAPSVYKWIAWRHCYDEFINADGWNFKIIGYNCMQFSVGFEYTDPDTGVVCFRYITRDYDRSWEVVC